MGGASSRLHAMLREHSSSGSGGSAVKTQVTWMETGGIRVPVYTNSFWTSRQRQASSIHEISYRACFKPQLPDFFIKMLTDEGDTVFDPFSGRGTTVIQGALRRRSIISNDINPLSGILTRPRLFPPEMNSVKDRLKDIRFEEGYKAEMDLSMFYHQRTLSHLVCLREYLLEARRTGETEEVDEWIGMVATSRLTGHSPGFFSVYTLPPNQAVSPGRQSLINKKLDQKPPYRDVKALIIRKTRSLLRSLGPGDLENLRNAGRTAVFLEEEASSLPGIPEDSADLTVTSPPFLNIVQYAEDNWLRCWFNGIDPADVESRMSNSPDLDQWKRAMAGAFRELHRVTKSGGWIAFEVGEIRKGALRLEKHVAPIGIEAGLECVCIVLNNQTFTKTSNIWGVDNNRSGTNSNRIVVFRK
ncbi:MAG: DNA methyltransferase [Thermoplasmatota archaeon]